MRISHAQTKAMFNIKNVMWASNKQHPSVSIYSYFPPFKLLPQYILYVPDEVFDYIFFLNVSMAPKCTGAVFGDTKITAFYSLNSFPLRKFSQYQWQYPLSIPRFL